MYNPFGPQMGASPMSGGQSWPDYSQFEQQQQGPPQTNYAQMALEQFNAPMPDFGPTEPAGNNQSWMMKALSGTLLGLAGGASAPDAGSAFAQGYAAVQQQREKEKQEILQMRELKKQEYLFHSKIAAENLEKIKTLQAIEQAPEHLRMAQEQVALQRIQAYGSMGKKLLQEIPNDPEMYKAALEALGKQGYGVHNATIEAAGGKIYAFTVAPGEIYPDNTPPIELPDGEVYQLAGKQREAADAGLKVFMDAWDKRERHKSEMLQLQVQGQNQINASVAGANASGQWQLKIQEEANKPYFAGLKGSGSSKRDFQDEIKMRSLYQSREGLIKDLNDPMNRPALKSDGSQDPKHPNTAKRAAIQKEILSIDAMTGSLTPGTPIGDAKFIRYAEDGNLVVELKDRRVAIMTPRFELISFIEIPQGSVQSTPSY